jgi:hypothetical protein
MNSLMFGSDEEGLEIATGTIPSSAACVHTGSEMASAQRSSSIVTSHSYLRKMKSLVNFESLFLIQITLSYMLFSSCLSDRFFLLLTPFFG